MKFYNRASELAELQRIQNLSFSDYSRLTVVTGRRRIGKTSLIMKSVEGLSICLLVVKAKQRFAPNLFLLSVNRLILLFLLKYAPFGLCSNI